MIKSFFWVVLIATSTLAHAQDSDGPQWDSQFQHQTAAGHYEVTPAIEVASDKRTFLNSSDTAAIKNFGVPVMGEYGGNKNFSFGLTLAYASSSYNPSCASGETCSSTTSKGLKDPAFYVNGTFLVGPGAIRTGANLSLALGSRQIDSSGNSNEVSGGVTLTPYIAYEIKAGSSGLVGARLSYDLYKGDQTVTVNTSNGSVTETITAGNQNEIAIYYENRVSQMVTIGGALLIDGQNESQSNVNGQTSPNHDDSTTSGVEIYVPIQASERVTLLPTVAAGSIAWPSSSGIDKDKFLGLGFGARILF